MREERFRQALRYLLSFMFVSPFLIWLLKIQHWTWVPGSEWLEIISITFLQAALSSVVSVGFGFFLFLSSTGFRKFKEAPLVDLVLLLPNLIPPIFIIVAVLSLQLDQVFNFSPLFLVIFAHGLINAGLVAVGLRRLFQMKVAGFLEAARVDGVSSRVALQKIVLPILSGDILTIYLFVFSICMTSLSIPLMLGGMQATSFEIAIYQAIRLEGEWSKAVVLAVAQSLFLFTLAMAIPRSFWPAKVNKNAAPFFQWAAWRWLVFLPIAILALGWALSFQNFQMNLEPALVAALPQAALNTLILGLGVGLFHLSLLLLVSYLLPHCGLSRFLNGYMAPSAVIIGFAMLLLPGESSGVYQIKLIFALTIWSFPFLYRWLGHSLIQSLRPQVEVARSLGASYTQILWRVVFPQCASGFFTSAGVAAIWACGDFALTSILAGDQWTWALIIEQLLANYQMDMAALMLLPLLVLSAFCFLFFKGVEGYVTR